MAYKVVRPFAYYADGIHAVELIIGDEREDFGSSTDGLLFEKYIEEAAPLNPIDDVDEAVAVEPEVGAMFVAPENRVDNRRRRK
jgi:hypothetical protein